jgi:hypothetical protein
MMMGDGMRMPVGKERELSDALNKAIMDFSPQVEAIVVLSLLSNLLGQIVGDIAGLEFDPVINEHISRNMQLGIQHSVESALAAQGKVN